MRKGIATMSFGRCSYRGHLALLSWIAVFGIVGCSGSQSSEKALDNALGQAKMTKGTVYPLGGKVTIDGQAPQLDRGQRLVVVLTDVTKPDQKAYDKPRVECDPQGEFFFSTYDRGDGIAAGTYVLSFGVFEYNMKKGLLGPDRLKNLYNDPDKNAQIAEFKIDHKAPGKKDYAFDLQTAGKEPVTSPGPKAITSLSDSYFQGK